MIMLDLQKAFGTVDHSILCGRLESIGVNPVNWLYSYISNRVWTVCQTKTWNFRTMYGNLWGTPGWGHFYFSFRACSSYKCFVLRARRLYSKLLKQEYLVERLKSSFRKFYGRYGDLIQQYEVSLSRMLKGFLTLDQQWRPSRSDFSPISWPWYRTWPSPNYEWFPWSNGNGCDMPAGNACPSGHLVPSPLLGFVASSIIWGLSYCYMAL